MPGPRAEDFRNFGLVAGPDSPLYGHVCDAIAGSPELLELAATSSEPMANLFLAAIHAELLREPDDELAAYYPTAGGTRAADAGLRAALERFCVARHERLEETLATRHTQTNETARCSALLPAFASVADGRPLAQIEIGASAGLNGLWDHYAYDYGGRAAGEAGSPLQIACDLVGPVVPPLEPPPVAWRAGIDRSPVDLRDDVDVRWLRACLWPDQAARQARLDAALQVAREHGPVEIHRGDALELLPGVIDSAPRRRARLRVPHRDAHLLRRREDRRIAAAARGARRRVDRRRGARVAGGGEHRPDPALRAHRRPRRRTAAARPHGPPRRLAGVVLGIFPLEAA